jgi:hypothetical protein
LIWGATPALLNIDTSTEFTSFIKSFRSILAISFLLKERLSLDRTLFIPSDNGYFIGEQAWPYLKFIHYFDKESVNEEDISKRIRYLKKILAKIFSEFSSGTDEFLKIEEHALRFDINDDIALPEDLIMIGINALLREKTQDQGFRRGLKSLQAL